MRVVITGFNRPEYMRQTIASWAKVRGIENVPVEFHLEPGHPEVWEVCADAPFPSAVYVAGEHQGVQRNPWKAANHAFRSSDFAVLAEDDIIVGADTIEYFLWAEEEFRFRDDVLAVSAANQGAGDPADLAAVSAECRFSGWVWGTWKDRWKFIGPDWTFNYEHRGWDYRLNLYWCQEERYRTVVPHMSRAQHIGQYGGTHCTPGQFEELQSRCFVPDAPPQQYRIIHEERI